MVFVHAVLISQDCSEIGADSFYTYTSLSSSNAAYGQYTCSPKQCTMVTNAAAVPSPAEPAECDFTTGTCTAGASYGFTKANVFKNMVSKTCDADLSASTYPDICSRTALAQNFMLGASSDLSGKAHLESGIRLLYCNDQYLVIHTVNVPNHAVGLLANPRPPGSGFDINGNPAAGYGSQTVTRSNVVQYSVYKIPLVPQDLGASSVTVNNKARFDATFTAVLGVATTAVIAEKGELTFSAATAGNIHAGYIITGAGLADKTVLSSCDSAEIVAGTGGVSSTTLNIAWTVIGSVCKDSKVASTCTDATAGKYVKISSAYIRLSNCSMRGGKGACTLASAQTVATGTTLQVFDSSTGSTVKCSISAATTAAIATSVTITGTHNSVHDLPSFSASNSPKAGINYPGIPIYGPLAVAVTGQVLYPVFDDQGFTSQEMCEVDMCNAHAGKGFDYHYHGDPYHHTPGKCLYSPADYADATNGHPPLIGFSLDGYKVYGRYLSESSIGYSTALDDCGGHSHGGGDFAQYHYHAQVKELTSIKTSATATSQLSTLTNAATPYFAPLPGVFKCWRGDIGAQRLFGNQVKFDSRAEFEDVKPCTGTKHYWRHGSLSGSLSGGQATALAASFDQFTSASPSWPGPPTAAPTPLSTTKPAPKPSPKPTMARPAGTAVWHSHHRGKTCDSAVFRYTVLPTQINTCSRPGPNPTGASPYTKLSCSVGEFYVHFFKTMYPPSNPACSAPSSPGSVLKKQAVCTRDDDGGSYVKTGCGAIPYDLWSRAALVITSISAPAGQAYNTAQFPSLCAAAAASASASAYESSVSTEYLLLDACAPVFGLPSSGDRNTVLYRRKIRVVSSSGSSGRIAIEEAQYRASDERCSEAPKRIVSAQYSSSSSSSSLCLPDPLLLGRWYSNAVLRPRYAPPDASPKPTRRPSPPPPNKPALRRTSSRKRREEQSDMEEE